MDYHILTLNSEISVFGSDLDKKMGTLLYLENIKKENSSEMEPCPICCFNSDSGVSKNLIFLQNNFIFAYYLFFV